MKPTEFLFELGQEVRDIVTGFTGVVRGRTQYLTGCNNYGVQSRKLSDTGKPEDWLWFDENVLTATDGAGVNIPVPNPVSDYITRGGPHGPDQVGRVC